MGYDIAKKLCEIDGYVPPVNECKIKLDANESFIDITKEAPEIADRIINEVKKISLNRYPDPTSEELVSAFADYCDVPAKCITAGNGSDEMINLIIGSMLCKGETLVTLSPDFSMYAFYGNIHEVNVYQMQKDESYTVNIPKIIDYCNNNNVKAVIFSNPCNPTSLGVPRSDIIKLVKNLFCLVIIDEAYMDFWDESVMGEVTNYDNLVVLRTCSKAMGIAGLRVGFAAAGETVTNALRTAKSPYNVNSVTEVIAKNILMEKEMLRSFTDRIVESRRDLNKKLSDFAAETGLFDKVFESVTNFIFVRSKYSETILGGLSERGIAIKKVGPNHLRITAGSPEENEALLAALNEISEERNKGE